MANALTNELGDLIWVDANGNGIQDPGEVGLSGVTVKLWGLDSATWNLWETSAATSSTGRYTLSSFVSGDQVKLQFILPAGYGFTQHVANSTITSPTNSDVIDKANGYTDVLTINNESNGPGVQLGNTITHYYVDAGVFKYSTISDWVWADNYNGIQDNGEIGLSDVTVRLCDSSGNVVKDNAGNPIQTTTDSFGHYTLGSVAPGTYKLQFVSKAGYVYSPQHATTGAKDSDADKNGYTDPIVITSGSSIVEVAAGMTKLASLGNKVWLDNNADGLQQKSEPGVKNVTVELTDSNNVKLTTTTDKNGAYSFSDLLPGNYQVKFIAPSGYVFTFADIGNDNSKDSDVDRTGKVTSTISLAAGENNNDVDAGLYPTANTAILGDKVWNDANHDGKQDSGEAGIDGVKVSLLTAAGSLVTTTKTAGGGLYTFTEVVPGNYQVKFSDTPQGYAFTKQAANGTNNSNDSDPASNGLTPVFSLNVGETNKDVDAGLYVKTTCSIGDYVWRDANYNGLQDDNLPLANIVVRLYTAAGVFVKQTMSDVTGHYSFDDLPAGSYKLWFITPSDYAATLQVAGDGTNNSDINKDGWTSTITLTAGQDNFNVDAGLVKTATVGDYVWHDVNGNGVQDNDTSTDWGTYVVAGIHAITVKLFTSSNQLVATTVTDGYGRYDFKGLTPGDYKVQVVLPGSQYVFTSQNVGRDDLDSDVDQDTGFSAVFSLKEGETNNMIDAGLLNQQYADKVAIGNYVWHDVNGDGLAFDATTNTWEPGVAGIPVYLFDANNKYLASTTTNASGLYYFINLNPGSYKVQFAAPAHVAFSTADVSNNTQDGMDSDANVTTGMTGVYTLTAGQYDSTIDAGLYIPVSIGDKVWNDTDRDGIQDAGEKGIDGVTVKLHLADGSVKTTTTANGGLYSFDKLAPGKYQVEFVQPVGYLPSPKDGSANEALDSDADQSTGYTDTIVMISNNSKTNIDAGFYKHDPNTALIGDYVWWDKDGDGLQDNDESGIAKVVVSLYNNSNQLIQTVKTNLNGFYQFNEVVPGNYKVKFSTPSGFVATAKDVGKNDAIDSDVDNTILNGFTDLFSVAAGESKQTIDAGFYHPASISGTTWHDKNVNGGQDTGEAIWANIPVVLYKGDGTTVVASSKTNASGNYSFTNLAPGDYKVHFTAPVGARFSPQDALADDAKDSDVNANGDTMVFNLPDAGHQDMDAGLYVSTPNGKATVGDRVWLDADGNGAQGSESGVNGITVSLYTSTGSTAIATTTTKNGGYYSFTDLTPGDYKIRFDTGTTGYKFTTLHATGDAQDSDAHPDTGYTDVFTLQAGDVNNNIDAGVYKPVSIGDFVWNDSNGNGLQETSLGEKGIGGATVKLYDAAGLYIDKTVTSALPSNLGAYSFSGLQPGSYKVHFDALAGYTLTAQNASTNINIDSDADPDTGFSGVVTLTSGQTNNTIDAGIAQFGSIGDRLWNDRNADGIQNKYFNGSAWVDEEGIANQQVKLYKATKGTWVRLDTDNVVTDKDGYYQFDQLTSGQYAVVFSKPDGYVFTSKDQGNDDALDSDVMSTGAVYPVLAPGQHLTTIDAGVTLGARIGDFIWGDHAGFGTDLDGIQQIGEGGINLQHAGITLYLQNSSGTIVDKIQPTDGTYHFDVVPGTYRILANQNSVKGWHTTAHNVGGNTAYSETIDSDAPAGGANAVSDWLTVSAGQVYNDLDMGFTPLALDLDNNGIQTIARSASSASFDLFGNGQAIQSGWISAGDALLAVDNNHNGKIDDIHELFGGTQQGAGFAKLASFDSNHDDVVDANDAQFNELLVWHDLNGNHQTDVGELMSLPQAGVTSLNVNYSIQAELDANGNLQLERSLATLSDGSSVAMNDVYFNVSASDAAQAGVVLPSMAELLAGGTALEQMFGPAAPVSDVENAVPRDMLHLYDLEQ